MTPAFVFPSKVNPINCWKLRRSHRLLDYMMWYGVVHKRRSQSGRVALSSAARERGSSSDAEVRTFWCKKHRIFEIYGVSARTRGRGQFFAILCGRPFCTAPVFIVLIKQFNRLYYCISKEIYVFRKITDVCEGTFVALAQCLEHSAQRDYLL